ncbi:MAG: hypothetical protein ACYC9M_03185, partial [Desulfobulbaceae bacterium]
MQKHIWPKYVVEANGRVVYRPRIPREKQGRYDVDKYGFLKPPIRLGKVGDHDDVIIRAYIKAKDSLDAAGSPKKTLYWVREQWLRSRQFTEMKSNLQIEYERRSKQFLENPVRINKLINELGTLFPHQITKVLLRNILDKALERYHQNGMHGGSTINGQFASFSVMISWAIEYISDVEFKFGQNPCFGINRLDTRKRE